MKLEEITQNIGAYTKDCVLITKAEPFNVEGPEIVWCNDAFTEMTEYTLDEVRGQNPRFLQGPDTDRAALDEIRAALEAWRPIVTVVKNYTKSGAPFFAELSIVPVADASGWFQYWVSVQRDVTERVERERHLNERNRALQESERALQEEKIQLSGIAAVAQYSQDLITITDTEFRILWANPAFIKRSGYPAAAVRGSLHCDLLSKRGEIYTSRELAINAILKGDFQNGEVRNIARDGAEYWTDVRVSVQRDDLGRPKRFVVVERDVTDQRRQRQDLEQSRRETALASIRDPLTGLLNRRGFGEALVRMAAKAEELGHGVGLLQVDLDHFKQINDTLGHAAGDAVLRTVAERLQGHLGPDSFCGRTGGDEFVIAVELHHEDQDLQRFSDRLLRDVARPVTVDRMDCRLGACVGFSQRPAPPFVVSDLMVEADLALYRAKHEGRNGVCGFTAEIAAAAHAKKRLADDIGVAIENGDFFPLYQPQHDAKSGVMVGAEALARWDHPVAGRRAPLTFLPLARELNLESEIDRLILEKTLADLERIRAAGVALPRMSVNVSSRRLGSRRLVRELDRMTIPPDTISFELLDSTFLDDWDDQITWNLDALKERRIGIEIDDFGTGHASIMGLLRVAPDRLKADKSLLSLAIGDPRLLKLYEHIIQIGHTLGIEVTAEGVETEEHAQVARDLGCSVLQGFHFARPMAAEDLIAAFQPRIAV